MTPRIAYTVDHCWHRVAGGTAVATVETARAIDALGDVELIGVAARHTTPPIFAPPIRVETLPVRSSRLLYAGWLWAQWPQVERATGPVKIAHATAIVPCPSAASLVSTVHDLAFLRNPEALTRRARALLRRSAELVRTRASLVLCPSQATMDDCVGIGFSSRQLRLVPLGVRPNAASGDDIERVRAKFGLPDRYALFVGTIEPRKNVPRLVEAMSLLEDPLTLVIAGPTGWGDVKIDASRVDARFVGAVTEDERDALYAGAAVCCYPSTWEGFGLPVLEAMSAGSPVVTSRGISTEEVAGGAAVLVDPRDVPDIARGIADALRDADRLRVAGRARAAACTWEQTARLTVAAYRELTSW